MKDTKEVYRKMDPNYQVATVYAADGDDGMKWAVRFGTEKAPKGFEPVAVCTKSPYVLTPSSANAPEVPVCLVLRLLHWSITNESVAFGEENIMELYMDRYREMYDGKNRFTSSCQIVPPTSFATLCEATTNYCTYLATRGTVSDEDALLEQTYLTALVDWLWKLTPTGEYEAYESRCIALARALPLLRRTQLISPVASYYVEREQEGATWDFWVAILTAAFY
jgi:hypothetical protein